jgi:hypothetical protein
LRPDGFVQCSVCGISLPGPEYYVLLRSDGVLADGRCHASQEELVAAITGNYREEHLFALRQNFKAYQFVAASFQRFFLRLFALTSLLATTQPGQ